MSIPSTGLSDIEKGRNTRRKKSAEAPIEGLPLMTRQQLVPFLNGNGFPISESVLSKLSSPKVGKGPPIHSYWGKRPLHAPGPALEWAKGLLRDRPTDIAAQNRARRLKMCAVIHITKENPGNAVTRAGVEGFGSWITSHEIQHPCGILQAV